MQIEKKHEISTIGQLMYVVNMKKYNIRFDKY